MTGVNKLSYSFARHETFHIRTGWLKKGIDALDDNKHIFLETIPAMDKLGIGKNMISSLRYWLEAVGLTEEGYNNRRQKIQEKTDLGKNILKYDKYFEDEATFWLLHFNLASNKKKATSWYWFFNHFNNLEFDKELFIEKLKRYIKRSGEEPPAQRSLESDFNVLRRMYLYDPEEEIHPESSKVSPFRGLKLIKNEEGKYKINRPNPNNLPPKILYYCILNNLDSPDVDYVNVEEVLNDEGSVGRIFKLNMTILHEYLEILQDLNYLRLDRQAGLNSIKLLKPINEKEDILKEYYNSKLYYKESDTSDKE